MENNNLFFCWVQVGCGLGSRKLWSWCVVVKRARSPNPRKAIYWGKGWWVTSHHTAPQFTTPPAPATSPPVQTPKGPETFFPHAPTLLSDSLFSRKKKLPSHFFLSPNPSFTRLLLFVSVYNRFPRRETWFSRLTQPLTEMVSPENTNWLYDYDLIDDIPVADGNFSASNPGFSWPAQALNGSSNVRY